MTKHQKQLIAKLEDGWELREAFQDSPPTNYWLQKEGRMMPVNIRTAESVLYGNNAIEDRLNSVIVHTLLEDKK